VEGTGGKVTRGLEVVEHLLEEPYQPSSNVSKLISTVTLDPM